MDETTIRQGTTHAHGLRAPWRPCPKRTASRTRWDRVPRGNSLLHQRLGSPARASRFLTGAVGGEIRPAHPAVGTRVLIRSRWRPSPTWRSVSSEHRTGVAGGLALPRSQDAREQWPSTRRSGSAGMPCCWGCRSDVPAGRAAPLVGE